MPPAAHWLRRDEQKSAPGMPITAEALTQPGFLPGGSCRTVQGTDQERISKSAHRLPQMHLQRLAPESGLSRNTRQLHGPLIRPLKRVRAGRVEYDMLNRDGSGSGELIVLLTMVTSPGDARAGLTEALGIEHPESLAVRANLAYWAGRTGDAVAARDQFAALLPASERVLGTEHPDTLTTSSSLAHWTKRAGGWWWPELSV